jgi:ribosomal protein S12 methylthiotransferase accessory factor
MDMEIYFPGGKRVYADYHGFTIQTDQSPESGGESSAPAPFELFLASIGTCAGIYALSFMQQRGIDPRVPGSPCVSTAMRRQAWSGTSNWS